jgi:DNA invertase Pin-like site-specific DNA recombinase
LESFDYIRRLKAAGVQFYSATEEHFSMAGIAGELFIALGAWIAAQERIRLKERIAAGLDRAKRNGTQLGRRPRMFDVVKAKGLRARGKSWRETARAVKVPVSVLVRRLNGANA